MGAAHHEEWRLKAHGQDWRRVEQQPSRTGEEKSERAEQQQPGEERRGEQQQPGEKRRAAAARRGEETSQERRGDESSSSQERRERAEQQPLVYILQTLVGQIGSPTTHLEAQSGKPKEGSAQPGRAAPWSDD